MNKYLCIQRSVSAPDSPPQEKPSPEEMQQMYEKFNAWHERYRDNIVDLGGRLGKGSFVSTKGATDGPFAETKELIGGYMIVAATSLDQAIEIASGVPGLVGPTSGVEVREIQAMS